MPNPIDLNEATFSPDDAVHASLWEGIRIDWVPLLGSVDPLFDLSGRGEHHLTKTGTGISFEMSGIHGFPVGRHTGSSGHLEHPTIAGFDLNDDDVWTVALRVSVTNTTGDQRTLFSKRVEGGSIQVNIRTMSGTAPEQVEVAFGVQNEVLSASVIEINTPYTIFLLNDGSKVSGGLTLDVFSAEGILLSQTFGTSPYSNNSPAAPFWLFAAFSNSNDPMVGDHAGVRGWDRLLTSEERHIQASDWHAPYRRRLQRRRTAVAVVAPGGLSIPVAMANYRRLRVG